MIKKGWSSKLGRYKDCSLKIPQNDKVKLNSVSKDFEIMSEPLIRKHIYPI
jgi:hypothetical protein